MRGLSFRPPGAPEGIVAPAKRSHAMILSVGFLLLGKTCDRRSYYAASSSMGVGRDA